MSLYRLVEVTDPVSGRIIHVSREMESRRYGYSVKRLISQARSGSSAKRFVEVRRILDSGQLPSARLIAQEMQDDESHAELRRLRALHDVDLSRKGSNRPRIHVSQGMTEAHLDPSPVYYVYELLRPDTGEVFYVGKGSNRHRPRVENHIYLAKTGKRGHKFSIIIRS